MHLRAYHHESLIKQAQLFISFMAIIGLATGCATPKLQPADPQLLFKSELAFIRDGATTREELLLKLGTPSGQFERDRILTYLLRVDKDGKWHLISPQINTTTGFREWRPETYSLVLVFGADGVLRKHSLVTAR